MENKGTDSEWLKEGKNYYTNIKELGPWEKAGTDDEVIYRLLKNDLVKTLVSVIGVEIIGNITAVGGIIVSLMKYDDIAMVIFLCLISILLSCRIYINIQELKYNRKAILDKTYRVCNITAFDIQDRHENKYCYVRDILGTVFQEKYEEQIYSKKVKFHSYFSPKSNNGKLVCLPLVNKNYYIVIPEIVESKLDK